LRTFAAAAGTKRSSCPIAYKIGQKRPAHILVKYCFAASELCDANRPLTGIFG
jgi:hypothetical protein